VVPLFAGASARASTGGGSGSLGNEGMESSVTSSGPSALARTSAALGAAEGTSAALASARGSATGVAAI
jgi:hypothetical protein